MKSGGKSPSAYLCSIKTPEENDKKGDETKPLARKFVL